ncbi:acyltransferase [Arthrobacter sp. ISL-95]|uniref:acyltransferase family protein n=1 Tax=Arthrobacter sp. ISL-95 TaxID=2819116 RepID=UPI001BE93264|nr:acyltransferase [Arthrobacter sp. ISL-95]MBT2585625.1 acyltransferase [Arthrobacter sp. ISL-95]
MGKTRTASARIPSLDGLRGVAAFVVLISHIMLTFPAFAIAVYETGTTLTPGTWDWWITYTPLHMVWAGHEAVYVFFVLSGFVLTLPVIARESYSWRQYYPKRLVRLYAPVIGAVVLGIGFVFLAPRDDSAGLGPWLRDRPVDPTLWGTLKDMTLVAGPSRLISPLWSLQWEILFSLLLPAYILFAVRQRRMLPIKLTVILLVVAAGCITGQQALIYMPMFAIGSLMAEHMSSLGNWARQLGGIEWGALFATSTILASTRWTLPAITADERASSLATVPALVGCVGIVVTAAYCPAAKNILNTRLAQWLGLVSFSLYLTHEPIVIALAFFFGPGGSWLVALTAIPTSLAVGWLFFLAVERPSHRLAQRVGKAFSKKAEPELTATLARR